jgi:thiol-disulfide isomerase/thioredoxin
MNGASLRYKYTLKPSGKEMKRSSSGSSVKRLVRAAAISVLFLAFALSGCRSSDEVPKRPTGANGGSSAVAPGTPTSVNTQPLAYNPANAVVVPEILRDASLNTLDGKQIKLSDYNGKVVVLNLWATWCGPCRMETPELISMSNDYKGQGVEFIGLATKENEEGRATGIDGVRKFTLGYKVPYPMVYTDESFSGPLLQMVNGPLVIPQSFVISRDGRLVAHFRGFSPTQTPPKLRAVIEQAVNDGQG